MRSFLPWALLLVVVRGVIVLSLGDAFFYGEELEKATAGKAMLDGLGVAHHQLAYHYYEGGGFVFSHLKAAAFYLFGETLLANKLLALASCLAVLGAGWWACGRAFGRAAAHAFAALYVFAPAVVQKLSLISLGIHHEACVFILCGLGLTAALMEEQRSRTWFLLGICLGFGTYFSWVMALVSVTCAGALLLRWRGGLDKVGVFAGLSGVLLGAAPLLLMFQEVGAAVLDIHGTGLAEASARSASESVRDFLRSIYIEGALGGLAAVIAWPAVILAALFAGARSLGVARRGWSRSFLCFAGFAVVFTVAYLSSAFVQGGVYHFFLMLRLVPLWVVGIALLAAVIGRSWEEAGRESRAWRAGALLALLGCFATVECVLEGRPMEMGENWGLLKAERGYVYPGYFAKLIPHLEGGREEQLEALVHFNEAEPALLREGIASELFRRHGGSGESLELDYAAARRTVEAVEPGRFPEYQRGLGPLIVDWHGDDLAGALAMTQSGGEDAPVLAEALGRKGRGERPRGAIKTLAAVEDLLLEDLALVQGLGGADGFARGVGWRLHRILLRTVYKPWRSSTFMERVPESLRGAVRGGFEEAAQRGRFNDQP